MKVGDEVDVMILAADEAARKITLSIKACIPEEHKEEEKAQADEQKSEKKTKRAKSVKQEDAEAGSEWNEDLSNNPFADLLKGLGEDNK